MLTIKALHNLRVVDVLIVGSKSEKSNFARNKRKLEQVYILGNSCYRHRIRAVQTFYSSF